MIYRLNQVFKTFGLDSDVDNVSFDRHELTLGKGDTDVSDADLLEILKMVEQIYVLTDHETPDRPEYVRITFDYDNFMVIEEDLREY